MDGLLNAMKPLPAAYFIFIVRCGLGLLSDVMILRPNMSILHVQLSIQGFLGLHTKSNVRFFHISTCFEKFLLLECTEQIEPRNPKEI